MFKKSNLAIYVAATLSTACLPVLSAAATDVKQQGTATNVAINKSFEPVQYSTKGKPNVLVVVMDDLGYGQLNYDNSAFDKTEFLKSLEIPKRYEANIDKAIDAAKHSTPYLRTLADNGVMLQQGFVAHGVSGPSRAAIMTSRAPSRYGIYSNDDAEKGVSLDETFLAKYFQDYGYSTAAIGKWHVSEITNVPIAKDKQTRDYHDNFVTYANEPYQPQNRGFGYFFGYHNSGAAYYNSPSLFQNRENVQPKGYLTEQLTDQALKVMKNSKADDKPFFVYLAYPAVHIPLEKMAPKKYQIFHTGNQDVDNYYATINAVDQNVKRIMDTLKKSGQADNTMVFFLADNGAVIDSPLPMNGQFKGNKGTTWSGGVHVPMFVYWKGKLQSGLKYKNMVSSMDIMPTALAAAGIPLPTTNKKLDGVNLLPYLNGKTQGTPHEYLYWAQPRAFHWNAKNIPFWTNYDKFVSGQSDEYPHNPYREQDSAFTWTVRDAQWALHYYTGNQSYELYRADDVSEQHNVAAQNPQVVTQLKQQIHGWMGQATKPATDNNQPKYQQLLDGMK
ncbi:sulfatase [Jeongeupia sp. HS-3]|uniref:sulfatase family protein n=1 Tax=Jeongeupia sp. HS-3 TaxID=1009682 RepID=UPI0018A45E85|nr:sulfatase-like hydrolase/transferase [Jeongeupia sp. HS-3]BCL75926.1 sulfatase [Jeongeupia sp. HS-3]